MAKRRGHGEGSIYPRKVDGKVVGWVGMVDLGWKDGKRQRHSVTAPTKAEAASKVRALLAGRDKGMPVVTKSPTVAEWLERWLTDESASRRHKTQLQYVQISRQHLIPHLGRLQVAKMTPADVRQLLNLKLEAGLSPRTVHHIRAVLRNALHKAEADGLVARNVASLAGAPHVPHREMKSLTPEQVKTLRAAVEGDDMEALYVTTLALGLRQGEALGLRWSNVDLDAGRLQVTHALQRVGGQPTFVEPKSRTARRTLGLSPVLVDLLRAHKARQTEGRLQLGGKWLGQDLVFCGAYGQPLEGTQVTKRFQAVLAAAGLPRLRFHDLRHSCASLLLAEGISPRMVQEILGHSNISLTLGTYSHVLPVLQEQAVLAQGRVLGGLGNS